VTLWFSRQLRHGDWTKPRLGLVLSALALTSGCLPPKAVPLRGAPAPSHILPLGVLKLPSGHHRIRFNWKVTDPRFSASGDGAARIAFPDSARLDFIAGGPFGGSGRALLFDDTLVAPGGGGARRYLPTTPFLWAALGRLALPTVTDTTVRIDGDTVRADFGPPLVSGGTIWRASFAGGELTGLARVSGGRVRETVVRDLERGRIQYNNAGAHRSLTLTQVRSEAVEAFDSTVWHP
jgi:hypothetical protein